MKIRNFLLLSALSLCASSLAIAQSPPDLAPTNPVSFCPNGTVIIVDDVRQCRVDDTLDTLIADFEQAEILGNPIEPMSKTTFYFIIITLIIVDLVQSRYQKKIIKLEEEESKLKGKRS